MFHYLYYKLYQATLKGSLNDVAEYAASIYFGGLIGVNFLVINLLVIKLEIIPNLFQENNWGKWYILIFVILSCVYFLYNRRYKAIIDKYSQESKKNRIKGNTIVVIYVAISFFSIFAIAFFRNGKL